MPREIIEARWEPLPLLPQDVDGESIQVIAEGPSRVEVGWHRENEWVQVVTCKAYPVMPELKITTAQIGEGTVTLGTETDGTPGVGEIREGGKLVGTVTEAGWIDRVYVDLDRKGINDLIRVLRRARDQAFGRDE